ncbi:MAG: tetratricopeptide repeat protein [Chitinivibrionales bacterium]|nr:tetratricopeptide repeat protein [Chitinivibrionales bacterium]
MKSLNIFTDRFFYPVLAAVWIASMLMLHSNFSYRRKPLPSVDLELPKNRGVQKTAIVRSSINELKSALSTENDPQDQLHILHNLGIAYYDMHSLQQGRSMLDSAVYYFMKSVEGGPEIARFYYNLGRTYTTLCNHRKARTCYEKALQIKPDHILALHNLGLVYYFEFNNPGQSNKYLQKLLKIDRDLPICNYVLGEIYLDKKEYKRALAYFINEVQTYQKLTRRKFSLPIAKKNLQYAAATAYLRMTEIFAEKIKNRQNAAAAFASYLALENNIQRKSKSLQRMKKYGFK